MKVAKLVYVSLLTRVVVDNTATQEEILEKSKSSLIVKINSELGEHLEQIVNDEECPVGEHICMNCEYDFDSKVKKDKLGTHVECPMCQSTSNVDVPKPIGMKAKYNIKTRILEITGKEIKPFKVKVPKDQFEDYWSSVSDRKTGEPLYDINLYFDDFAEDGADEQNPKNYQAQFVNLEKNEKGEIIIGFDYQTLPLKVSVK